MKNFKELSDLKVSEVEKNFRKMGRAKYFTKNNR